MTSRARRNVGSPEAPVDISYFKEIFVVKPAHVSCIFPVHNEANLLASQLKKFTQSLSTHEFPVREIILVENGSIDTSWQIITRLRRRDGRIRAVRLPRASYGQAVRAGMEAARGQILFVLNVDFFDVPFMQEAMKLLKVADVVIASKTLGASDDQRSFTRRWVTYFFNVLLRLVLNYPGTDTHGIKAFKRTKLLQYALMRCRTHHELFDTELIIRMTRWGARLMELPITVREIRPSRYPVVRRLISTTADLFSALWTKLLIPGFPMRVVTADDFGISSRVNRAILRVAREKLVQIVSILPTMASESSLKQLRAIPNVSFSAHLNVVEGKPVSPSASIPTLINRRGHFYPSWHFFWRIILGMVNTSDIEQEFAAQIKRLKTLGVSVTHVDSHQHWHLFPPLWNVVVKLSDTFAIGHIRSFDSARFYLRSKPLRYVAFLLIHLLLRLRYGKGRFSTKTVDEIIVHPGTDYDRLTIDNPPPYR